MDSDQGKLFIGGISWETTEEKLKEHFSQYGDVMQTAVMRNKTTGRPRSFGFVIFSEPSVLDIVLQEKHTIDGRTVEAKRALSREEQQTNARSGSTNMGRSTGVVRTKKIFVGGLPSSLTEDEFRQYFTTFGNVEDAVIMYDQNTQRPRGFGFISFDDEDAVDRVLHKTFHDLNGKKVEVKRALPKDANIGGGNRSNTGVGGGNYQGYGGSGGNDHNYEDSTRYMQAPGSGGGFPPMGLLGTVHLDMATMQIVAWGMLVVTGVTMLLVVQPMGTQMFPVLVILAPRVVPEVHGALKLHLAMELWDMEVQLLGVPQLLRRELVARVLVQDLQVNLQGELLVMEVKVTDMVAIWELMVVTVLLEGAMVVPPILLLVREKFKGIVVVMVMQMVILVVEMRLGGLMPLEIMGTM